MSKLKELDYQLKNKELEGCDCHDCLDDPCHFDCDLDAECTGCREARLDQEEIQSNIDRAIGRE